jgi:lysophospholipase L1-like esterase
MRKLLLLLLIGLTSFTTTNKKILFVGDSLSCYNGGWQTQVAKGLGKDYNRVAKVGKRTDWMLSNLKKHLINNSDKYDTVFIYGGINDAYSGYTKNTISNLQKMVDLCNHYNIKPIVIMGYNPLNVAKGRTKLRNKYISLQKQMLSLKDCKIIPIENTINRHDTSDGIHLKISGHKKFSKFVLENLDI